MKITISEMRKACSDGEAAALRAITHDANLDPADPQFLVERVKARSGAYERSLCKAELLVEKLQVLARRCQTVANEINASPWSVPACVIHRLVSTAGMKIDLLAAEWVESLHAESEISSATNDVAYLYCGK